MKAFGISRYFRYAACLALAAAFYGCATAPTAEPGRSYIAEKGAEVKKAAMQAYSDGDLRSAREKFMEALRIDRSIENRSAEVEDLINIGRVNILLGEYEPAKYYLYDAVRVGSDTKDERNLSDVYSSLALADQLTGDYAAALDSIDEAINIDSRRGYVSGARLNQKAVIFIETGRKDEAATLLKQAIEINRTGKDIPEIANSYRAMGDLSESVRNYDEAFGYYMKAYNIDKSHGDERKMAVDLERMGELKVKSGSPGEAIEIFEKSYIVRLNCKQTAEALANLSRLIETCRSVGDERKAGFYQRIRSGIIENSSIGRAGTR